MQTCARHAWRAIRPWASPQALATRLPTASLQTSRALCAATGTDALHPESVSYLLDASGQHEVYLVGTSHVSDRSADQVAKIIEVVKPEHVMVELCKPRADRLRAGDDGPSGSDIIQRLLENLLRKDAPPGFGMEAMLQLGFKGLYAALRQYGLIPGQEFKVALEEADRLGLPVCYGDVSIDLTMSKLTAALRETSLSRLFNQPAMPPDLQDILGGLDFSVVESLEKLKNRAHIALLREHMTKALPDFMDVMVRQRDLYMTNKLLQDCGKGRVVAVVGMAHMDGIELEWQNQSGQVFLHEACSLKSKR